MLHLALRVRQFNLNICEHRRAERQDDLLQWFPRRLRRPEVALVHRTYAGVAHGDSTLTQLECQRFEPTEGVRLDDDAFLVEFDRDFAL